MLQDFAVPTAMFIIGLVLGFVLGWLVHKTVSKKEIANWERALITVIVTMAWAFSVVLDVLVVGYETPVAIHAVMGLVAGYFFEGSILDVIKKK